MMYSLNTLQTFVSEGRVVHLLDVIVPKRKSRLFVREQEAPERGDVECHRHVSGLGVRPPLVAAGLAPRLAALPLHRDGLPCDLLCLSPPHRPQQA